MSLLKTDPLTQLAFSIYENKGIYAILLGSGLSRSAQIPTGWEITVDLIKRIGLAQGTSNQSDWVQWYRDKTGLEPSYSAILEDIANSPNERRSILHGYIEPNENERQEGLKSPTAAHRAIASLVQSGHIKVIITTNFDRLMEGALRDLGIEPTVVFSEDSLLGAEPLSHSQCYLLKLHGDYKDARILNTDEELSTYPAKYNALLDRIFDEHGLIISGWSGEWDHALRAAFLRAPNRRYPVFWTSRADLGDNAKQLADHKKANIVTVESADAFFSSLQQRVETLANTQSKNPLSVDLLVNSTKRYLSNPEYRIKLDELILQELNIALEQINEINFSANQQLSAEEFQLRVKKYEGLIEALARMVGAIGRWGTGDEFNLVVEIIKTLYKEAQKVQNGTIVWINMNSYPTVLIVAAYGIGLTKAQRWKDLHTFLHQTVALENREPQNIIDVLFHNRWNGQDSSIWNQYNFQPPAKLKTPFSDHVLDVMNKWKDSFIGVESNFELLYEKYELLASLTYFEKNEVKDLEAILLYQKQNPTSDVLAYMPIGRVGWDEKNNRILVSEMETVIFRQALVTAGFAKNSTRFIDLYLINFNRYVGMIRWM